MKIINRSRKIIGISGEPLLPGETMELPEELEGSEDIRHYISKGVLGDADAATSSGPAIISDEEKERIEKEAIARYKAEQEELIRSEKEAEEAGKVAMIKAVKAMKKDALVTKAISMGIDVADTDTADALREKIFSAIGD